MTIWDTLGIEQTSDLSVIKAAYAQKAKEFHPEDHPTEFQNLQKAYKQAVKAAKLQQGQSHQTVPDYHAPKSRITPPSSALLSVLPPTVKSPHQETVLPVRNQTDSKEQILPEEVTFSYEEVNNRCDIPRFFYEFQLITQNPYLQNHIPCWSFFLNRSPYQPLLSDSDFRRKLAKTVCKTSGWTQTTLSFLTHYISAELKEDPALKQSYIALWDKNESSPEPSSDWKYLHDLHMKLMYSYGLGNDLNNDRAISFYLDSYFRYPTIPQAIKEAQAKPHKTQTQDQYRNNRIPPGLIIFIIICAIICCYFKYKDYQEKHSPWAGSPSPIPINYGEYPHQLRSSPTPSVPEGDLKTPADLPSDRLQEALRLALKSPAEYSILTCEEINISELPPVFKEVLCGDFSHIAGSYDASGTIIPFASDEQLALMQEYENRISWSFCLIDLNHDGIDDLCVRNENGQIGYVISDKAGLQGTLYNWTLYTSQSTYYSDLFEKGTENFVPLADGNCFHIKKDADEAQNLTFYLCIEHSLPDGSTEILQKAEVLIINDFNYYVSSKLDTNNFYRSRGTSKNVFYYYDIDLTAGTATSITEQELDAWLEEQVLSHLIPDDAWHYISP